MKIIPFALKYMSRKKGDFLPLLQAGIIKRNVIQVLYVLVQGGRWPDYSINGGSASMTETVPFAK